MTSIPNWLIAFLVFAMLVAMALLWAQCVVADPDGDPPYQRWGLRAEQPTNFMIIHVAPATQTVYHSPIAESE